MTFQRLIPMLRVADAARAEAFYAGVLGFTVTWKDDPGDDHPVFLEVAREGVALHLSEHTGDGPEAVSLYINVGDIEALYAAVVATGAEAEAPEPMPWGERVFTLTDPDGNTLRFGAADKGAPG